MPQQSSRQRRHQEGPSVAWLAPDYSIVAQLPPNPHKGSSRPEIFYMAPSLAKMPSGTLIAAIARGRNWLQPNGEGGRGLESMLVCNSKDGGHTWKQVCELPYDGCEPNFYVHEGRLYLFFAPQTPPAGSNLPKDTKMMMWGTVSDDDGLTWSAPVPLVLGARPHRRGGDSAMLTRNGKLYFEVSDNFQPIGVVSCQLDKGILNPDSWRISELVQMPIPSELVHGTSGHSGMRCLEGNVVEVGGRMLMIARAVINQGATANMAAVFEILDEGDDRPLKLQFLQLYPVPGGQCKFYIVHDEPSQMYWMASNLPTNTKRLIPLGSPGQDVPSKDYTNDRRLLTLWYSLDALNWIPAGWIAKADAVTQAFSCPVMLVDGDDMVLVSRTSRDSGDQHDADMVTFHRIKEFRNLAVQLMPSRP